MEYLCDVHHSISPRQLPVPNDKEAGSENKMSAWGDLKSSCHVYLPWGGGGGGGGGRGGGGGGGGGAGEGLTMFLVKKRF